MLYELQHTRGIYLFIFLFMCLLILPHGVFRPGVLFMCGNITCHKMNVHCIDSLLTPPIHPKKILHTNFVYQQVINHTAIAYGINWVTQHHEHLWVFTSVLKRQNERTTMLKVIWYVAICVWVLMSLKHLSFLDFQNYFKGWPRMVWHSKIIG